MAADVKTGPTSESGAPKALFQVQLLAVGGAGNAFRYDVAADGKRFLVNTAGDGSAGAPITVVNWQAAAKR